MHFETDQALQKRGVFFWENKIIKREPGIGKGPEQKKKVVQGEETMGRSVKVVLDFEQRQAILALMPAVWIPCLSRLWGP